MNILNYFIINLTYVSNNRENKYLKGINDRVVPLCHIFSSIHLKCYILLQF